jgi:hypothetical protein
MNESHLNELVRKSPFANRTPRFFFNFELLTVKPSILEILFQISPLPYIYRIT